MLFIIIPTVVLCAVLVYQYLFFIRVYYIGQSLHKFRELRCEAILSLSDNVNNGYSFDETKEHHLFLLRLNAIITNLDAFGPRLFTFKSVLGIYSKILFSSETITANSNNGVNIPLQYKEKVRESLFTALKAIPLLRFRFFIFLLKVLAMFFIKSGANKYKQELYALEKIAQFEKDKGISCQS